HLRLPDVDRTRVLLEIVERRGNVRDADAVRDRVGHDGAALRALEALYGIDRLRRRGRGRAGRLDRRRLLGRSSAGLLHVELELRRLRGRGCLVDGAAARETHLHHVLHAERARVVEAYRARLQRNRGLAGGDVVERVDDDHAVGVDGDVIPVRVHD